MAARLVRLARAARGATRAQLPFHGANAGESRRAEHSRLLAGGAAALLLACGASSERPGATGGRAHRRSARCEAAD